MASTKEYLKGDYITAVEITKGDEAVIVETPEIIEKNYGQEKKKVLEGKVEYKNEVRKLTWNKTNAKECSKSFDDDTKGWLGKVVEFDTENKSVGGEIKKCLLILPKGKVVIPEGITEEMIQAKIDKLHGMISKEAAIEILKNENSGDKVKEEEVKQEDVL